MGPALAVFVSLREMGVAGAPLRFAPATPSGSQPPFGKDARLSVSKTSGLKAVANHRAPDALSAADRRDAGDVGIGGDTRRVGGVVGVDGKHYP